VLDTVQQVIARALQAVSDGGDHLLFLCGLVVAVRRARTAARVFAALVAGQAVTLVGAAIAPATTAPWLPAIAMVAASTIVIAALQNIVGSRLAWIAPLAIAFGVLNGFTFGSTLVAAQQFAGSHPGTALVTFLVVVMAAELWWGALMWATRIWLDGLGLSERIVTVLASALLAHSAVHRVVDRGQVVAQSGSSAGEHAVVWLTLAWACAIALVAVVEAWRGRPLHDDPDRLTRPVQA
jgi:hypothetical protein